eukprot:TRINITY_DN28026_c0_g1_i1.p1 TRINITY_DN28026_c0_g1~~TRINITY_DN28026_c0_g1_i1.p1  ORF type:complete len:436 (+),score=116.98 TRINITY_DN28026_c0_g1_i1:23-1309(+)
MVRGAAAAGGSAAAAARRGGAAAQQRAAVPQPALSAPSWSGSYDDLNFCVEDLHREADSLQAWLAAGAVTTTSLRLSSLAASPAALAAQAPQEPIASPPPLPSLGAGAPGAWAPAHLLPAQARLASATAWHPSDGRASSSEGLLAVQAAQAEAESIKRQLEQDAVVLRQRQRQALHTQNLQARLEHDAAAVAVRSAEDDEEEEIKNELEALDGALQAFQLRHSDSQARNSSSNAGVTTQATSSRELRGSRESMRHPAYDHGCGTAVLGGSNSSVPESPGGCAGKVTAQAAHAQAVSSESRAAPLAAAAGAEEVQLSAQAPSAVAAVEALRSQLARLRYDFLGLQGGWQGLAERAEARTRGSGAISEAETRELLLSVQRHAEETARRQEEFRTLREQSLAMQNLFLRERCAGAQEQDGKPPVHRLGKAS